MSKRVRTTRRLEVWLKDTSVALFVLNSQRRLVFFNTGCEQLTGWTPSDVLGQICDYVTEADTQTPAALLASLAPPANVWHGQTIAVSTLLTRREQDPWEAVLHFFPLTDVAHKVQAALGIIQPAAIAPQVNETSISQRLHTRLAALRHALRSQIGAGSLLGQSTAMRRVFDQLRLAQQSSIPVLFVGESGTGREYFARTVHQTGGHNLSPFVPLDCRHLPADHLENVLRRMIAPSHSEQVMPGTVYLDQVDSLPRDLQRLVMKVIDSKPPKSPRVMAATLRPLERAVDSEDFLPELFYSLSPIQITVPPLRQRMEDLEPLAQYFLEESNRGAKLQITGFHDEVLQQFRRYNWPGNVGELKAVIAECRDACGGPVIDPGSLPFRFRTGVSGQTIGPVSRTRCELLDPLLLRIEREQIEIALSEARNNKAKAAELLGITRPRLYRRMEILGIIDPDTPSEPHPDE